MLVLETSSHVSQDVRLVCEQVVEILAQRMREGPTLGIKPLRLIQADVPRAVLNELPERYTVALTCLDSKRFNQLVYQFGHEMLHVFLNPHLIHPFAEVLACAFSLAILDLMKVRWTSLGGVFAVYASKFSEYREKVLQNAWSHVNFSAQETENSELWARTFQMGCDDRNIQLVAASFVEPWLRQQKCWTIFRLAHAAIETVDETALSGDWRSSIDAAAWRAACANSPFCDAQDCRVVESIIDLFALT